MVCLGLEPRVAGWKEQMNPLSYGGIPYIVMLVAISAKLLCSTLQHGLQVVYKQNMLVYLNTTASF